VFIDHRHRDGQRQQQQHDDGIAGAAMPPTWHSIFSTGSPSAMHAAHNSFGSN